MAGVNEPSDESVDVDLPHPTPGKSADSNIKSGETVQVQMPVPEPVDKPSVSSVMGSTDSPASGLKKETARVSLVPDPLPSAETKNPQQQIETPYVAPQDRSAAVASAEKEPMLVWWILLGISALILIIQIWTYIS